MNAAMLVQGLATGGPAEASACSRRSGAACLAQPARPTSAGASWVGPFDGAVWGHRRHAMRQVSPPRSTRSPSTRCAACWTACSIRPPSAWPALPRWSSQRHWCEPAKRGCSSDTEVTAEVLLASACLPQLFPAVEIDGERYWDGGFASNPPLRALIEAGAPTDIMLVRTTPVERPDPPEACGRIRGRADELAFASAACGMNCARSTTAQRLLAELPEPRRLERAGAAARRPAARDQRRGRVPRPAVRQCPRRPLGLLPPAARTRARRRRTLVKREPLRRRGAPDARHRQL